MQLLYTKRKCRNHGFLLAFFGDFLSIAKESYPSETKEERAAVVFAGDTVPVETLQRAVDELAGDYRLTEL